MTKKRIILITVNAFCLICFFVCLSISSSIRTPLRSQQAAAAWAGQSGERFSQVSVFFPESSIFSFDNIMALRSSIDRELMLASLESTDENSLYTDAWSAEVDVSVFSGRGSPRSAKAFAVGGDFFLFHPFNLRDGSYIYPNDLMKDRIVIDEELAWILFGAIHVAGFEVTINERLFIIAGVISRENDFASSNAYTYGAGLFMSFDMYSDMMGDNAFATTYEIVMADPITGFALDIMERSAGFPGSVFVENTNRFSMSKLFSLIGTFGERSMRIDSISFPYWENAARFAEDWLALILIFTWFFILFPIICAVIYIILLIRFLFRLAVKRVKKLIERRDKRKYDKYVLEHGDEQQIYDIDDIIDEYKDEIF